MNKQSTIKSICLVFSAVFLLVACGQDPPAAPRPKVQAKPISTPKAAPPSAVDAARPAATENGDGPANHDETLTSRLRDDAAQPSVTSPPSGQAGAPVVTVSGTDDSAVPPRPDSAESTENAKVSDLVQASLQIAGTYDPTGRFDPFEPIFKENSPMAQSHKDARKKRLPQTPLEQVALGQLKLSAIIRAASGNRALVEDATGKGYVLEKGTYVGLNSGQVIKIEKDKVIVEEEVENVLGELTVQATELKLQKPAGEL